jgi:hypothetical protein
MAQRLAVKPVTQPLALAAGTSASIAGYMIFPISDVQDRRHSVRQVLKGFENSRRPCLEVVSGISRRSGEVALKERGPTPHQSADPLPIGRRGNYIHAAFPIVSNYYRESKFP